MLVHFDKIVIPLSYSKSLLSMARSESVEMPVFFSRQSTRVVLP